MRLKTFRTFRTRPVSEVTSSDLPRHRRAPYYGALYSAQTESPSARALSISRNTASKIATWRAWSAIARS
jgi:hypothetical protein